MNSRGNKPWHTLILHTVLPTAFVVFGQGGRADDQSPPRALTSDRQAGPRYFEAGLVSAYQDATIVGLYLSGPVFWNLRPSIEVASRSSDKTRDDGTLSVRNDAQTTVSLGSRVPIAGPFLWDTKLGVGWYELRGRNFVDPADKKRTTTIFFSQFETGIGIWLQDNADAGEQAWIWSAQAGTSLRHNYRPTRSFVTEEGEILRSGGVGAFVRIGVGI